jgi:hypothetical protein
VTFALALANAGAYVAGWTIAGRRPEVVAVAAPVALLLLVAWGMWRGRYWAVLVTQVMLVLLVTLFVVLAVFAENLRSLAIAVAVVASAGTLFWYLVKAMARLRMPSRE